MVLPERGTLDLSLTIPEVGAMLASCRSLSDDEAALTLFCPQLTLDV
jgi:hypothetical protein